MPGAHQGPRGEGPFRTFQVQHPRQKGNTGEAGCLRRDIACIRHLRQELRIDEGASD